MKRIFLVVVVAAILFFGGISAASADAKELMGAGATFPYPLYQVMFKVYEEETGVRVNYQSVGSGTGQRNLLKKMVQFAGSDAIMDPDQMEKDEEILHIPIVLGAVAVTYHLEGAPTLVLAPDIIADVFLDKIKKWNDPRIQKLNPGIALPDMNTIVVHRADSSGTTYIFTDYLAKVSNEWKEKVGGGKSVDWPTGLGGNGNPGVASLITQIPGSIGYVEMIYAITNDLPVANVKNRSGVAIKPSIESVSIAADVEIPDHARVMVTDTDARYGYPISGFTWILLYKEQDLTAESREQAQEVVKLLWWMVHDGQKHAPRLKYSTLPEAALERAEGLLNSVVYKGKKLL